MAQSSPSGNSSTLCKYFMHGACVKGTSCNFSHDRSTPPDLVCRFYLKGQCAYGDRCRYDHTNRDKPVKSGSDFGKAARKENNPPSKGSPEKRGNGPRSPANMKAQLVSSLLDSQPLKSTMTPLGKGKDPLVMSTPVSTPQSVSKSPEEWVKAKEFTPGQFYVGAVPPTYASAVGAVDGGQFSCEDDSGQGASWEDGEGAAWDGAGDFGGGDHAAQGDAALLCPFLMGRGTCPYEDACTYTHGHVCDLCGLPILHPTEQGQRDQHIKECMEAHENDMEHSFAVAASREKTCGICMDVVLDKEPPSTRRFGILENCSHCFCLGCIRQWRCAKQFEKVIVKFMKYENKIQWRCAKQFEKVIVKACPECRVNSNFVTPSQLWVDSPDEKTKLIQSYKQALKDKPCRHFDQGRGECPFNDSCFYRHALPDGTVAPPQPRKPRRRQNADGELQRVLGVNLWDFLEWEDMQREFAQIEDSLEIMNYLAMELFDYDFESDSDSDGY